LIIDSGVFDLYTIKLTLYGDHVFTPHEALGFMGTPLLKLKSFEIALHIRDLGYAVFDIEIAERMSGLFVVELL